MGAGGRYLALHVDRTKARPRYAYLLFGAGPRVSIGASFAMIEATVIGWIIVGLWTTESLRTCSSPNQLKSYLLPLLGAFFLPHLAPLRRGFSFRPLSASSRCPISSPRFDASFCEV